MVEDRADGRKKAMGWEKMSECTCNQHLAESANAQMVRERDQEISSLRDQLAAARKNEYDIRIQQYEIDTRDLHRKIKTERERMRVAAKTARMRMEDAAPPLWWNGYDQASLDIVAEVDRQYPLPALEAPPPPADKGVTLTEAVELARPTGAVPTTRITFDDPAPGAESGMENDYR